MNVFDGMKRRVFDTVARTMGYDASWIPQDGSKPEGYSARILFNNPTEKKKLSDIDYDPLNWKMEYRLDQFPGLKEATDAAQTEEFVTIEGNDFFIRKIDKKWDGDTYIAELEPKM